MSLFQQILAQFVRIGLNENSKLKEIQIKQALNQLSNLNQGLSLFDQEVSEQLWQYCQKNPEGRITLKDYIQTIIDAHSVLSQNLEKCQKQLQIQQDLEKRKELHQCLLSYQEDLTIINKTFQIELHRYGYSPTRSKAVQGSQLDQNSQFFAASPSPREESTSLKIVFFLAFVMLLVQITCMFIRHHFLNILTYISILSVFFLQYFNSTYMKLILTELFLAVGLDIAWLVVHAENYWSPPTESQRSHHQIGFLIFVYLFTLFMVVGKFILFVLLFRFRQNDRKTKKYVQICSYRIELSGLDGSNLPPSLLRDGPTEVS